MLKLFFWCSCLLALAASPTLAQTSGPAIVVVKVYENSYHLMMDIARPDGKHEKREYKQRDLKPEGAAAEFTRQLLAQLYQEGYGLTSTYGGGDRYGNLNTLVFTKRL
jgi:hypothetical protein